MIRLPQNEQQIHWLNTRPQMWLLGLTFATTLTLNFQGQIWNLLYLSQKMVQLPRNEKQTYWLISRPQMWPSGLTLAMTLTLNFQGQIWNWLYLCQKMLRLPWNVKQTHRLNFRLQMWPSDLTLVVTLTLNFQGQIWNLLYLIQKWSDCHETKSKHIYLNSTPQMWPMGLTLPWPWYLNFSRSYVILTIWWPRSSVRIYQIVTGVTSDVGVPSTHIVLLLISVRSNASLKISMAKDKGWQMFGGNIWEKSMKHSDKNENYDMNPTHIMTYITKNIYWCWTPSVVDYIIMIYYFHRQIMWLFLPPDIYVHIWSWQHHSPTSDWPRLWVGGGSVPQLGCFP